MTNCHDFTAIKVALTWIKNSYRIDLSSFVGGVGSSASYMKA